MGYSGLPPRSLALLSADREYQFLAAMMVWKLSLRLVVAVSTYAFMAVATRAGGIFAAFVVLAPIAFFTSIFSDFGRSEMAVKYGYGRSQVDAVYRQAWGLTVIATGAMASLIPVLNERYWLLSALLFLGLVQGPADIIVKNAISVRRRQEFLAGYQLTVNAFYIVMGALAVAARSADQRYCFLGFFAVPLAALYLWRPQPRPRPSDIASDHRDSPGLRFVLVKLLPAISYSTCLLIWHQLAPHSEVLLRCMFFIYGFLHLGLMSRESTAQNRFRDSVAMIVFGLAAGVPLMMISGQSEPTSTQAIAPIAMAMGCAVLILVMSLRFYEGHLRLNAVRR